MLADGRIHRRRGRFDRDFRLELPARRKVLAKAGADLIGGGVIKRIARQLDLPVGDDERAGRQPRQRAERGYHRVGEPGRGADARLEVVDDLFAEELASRRRHQRGVDVVVRHVAGQRQRHRDRILVGLEDVRRRLDLVGRDRKALRQIFQCGGDGFPAAELARHAGQADLGVRQRDLAVLQLAYLVEQQQRGIVETRRRTARQIHPVDHFDATEAGAGRLRQPALARRLGRTARQRHPEDVAFGRPDERLGFGNEPGFIVNQAHARHRFHRRHRTLPAVFRESIRRKRHVAACDRDSPFVEDGILECGRRTLHQVGFKRFGARPGCDSPKDDQRNDARPPFATPPEKSVHSSSRRGPERRENKPLRGCQTRNVAGAETL